MAVAAAGGSAHGAMQALGLMDQAPPAMKALRGEGRGKRVVVLGAGLAGMCAAYELRKLGYDCTVLEARARAGGRAWTVRQGTEETEAGGERQRAAFAPDQYFNPGPARIPQHHQVTLNYCRELGVAVEPFINANDGALIYDERLGKAVRLRSAKADLRGYASELLAKAARQDVLDRPLSGEDRERLVAWLRDEGALAPDLVYRGGGRRGYSIPPGAATQSGQVEPPDELLSLLRAGIGHRFAADYDYDQQMTMLQIVGGADRLPSAFADRLAPVIRYQAEVREIRRAGNGVRIGYRDRDGADRVALADRCICTIPLPVLRQIPADWSASMRAAIVGITYAPAVKIGLQFGRRFWEDESIFGGISRTSSSITQIWYPSHGFLSARGILVGAYAYEGNAIALGELAPAERRQRALDEGRILHPAYDRHFEQSFSVAWQRIPFSMGAWASYSAATRGTLYPTLLQPEWPFVLAGEHTSYLTGWMAGALASGQRAATLVHENAMAGRARN